MEDNLLKADQTKTTTVVLIRTVTINNVLRHFLFHSIPIKFLQTEIKLKKKRFGHFLYFVTILRLDDVDEMLL